MNISSVEARCGKNSILPYGNNEDPMPAAHLYRGIFNVHKNSTYFHRSRQEWVSSKYLSYFSTKTYVVGTH